MLVSWLAQKSKLAAVVYTRKTHSAAISWAVVYVAWVREVYKEFLYCKYSLMRPVVRQCMRNTSIVSTQSYGASKNPDTSY